MRPLSRKRHNLRKILFQMDFFIPGLQVGSNISRLMYRHPVERMTWERERERDRERGRERGGGREGEGERERATWSAAWIKHIKVNISPPGAENDVIVYKAYVCSSWHSPKWYSNIIINLLKMVKLNGIKRVLLAVAQNRSLHVVHEAYSNEQCPYSCSFALQHLGTVLIIQHSCYHAIGKWSNWKTKMTTMNKELSKRSHYGS